MWNYYETLWSLNVIWLFEINILSLLSFAAGLQFFSDFDIYWSTWAGSHPLLGYRLELSWHSRPLCHHERKSTCGDRSHTSLRGQCDLPLLGPWFSWERYCVLALSRGWSPPRKDSWSKLPRAQELLQVEQPWLPGLLNGHGLGAPQGSKRKEELCCCFEVSWAFKTERLNWSDQEINMKDEWTDQEIETKKTRWSKKREFDTRLIDFMQLKY